MANDSSQDPDQHFMGLAIELAKQGEGFVEPNPMVGCILVRDGEIIGQGAHREYGRPHAEVNAIRDVAKSNQLEPDQVDLSGATAYVTLEPCSHFGKTGPCVQALLAANISRVVIACQDPNPDVNGRGVEHLRESGVEVVTGVLEDQVRTTILAPYLKRQISSKPWIIAKWAMTIDGKICTSTGDSKWISNEHSRRKTHQIRGRVDGVMVGIGTVLADDPLLTARPKHVRLARRIVVDSQARIPIESKLVQTANEVPTLIAVGPNADAKKCEQLKALGCEIFASDAGSPNHRLEQLLTYLSDQKMTNVLVEGGAKLLGSLHDMGQIDQVHAFIAPTMIGGDCAASPIGGDGCQLLSQSSSIQIQNVERIDDDVYIVGRILKTSS